MKHSVSTLLIAALLFSACADPKAPIIVDRAKLEEKKFSFIPDDTVVLLSGWYRVGDTERSVKKKLEFTADIYPIHPEPFVPASSGR